jgi:hypothetical protein
MKKKKSFTVRIGPLAMSLAAAAMTAVAFAAVSVADNGSDDSSGGSDRAEDALFTRPAPPGGGARVFFHDNLSDADKQKLEDFRDCMRENGAPTPPEPGEIDPSDPPKPPSSADREKLEQAFEACKDNLPEEMQKAGPPQLHAMGCGPGAPGEERGKQENQDQSDDSGDSSSGSTS